MSNKNQKANKQNRPKPKQQQKNPPEIKNQKEQHHHHQKKSIMRSTFEYRQLILLTSEIFET